MSVDSHVLKLKALFDPQVAGGLAPATSYGSGKGRCQVEIADGNIDLSRGIPHQPDRTIDTDPKILSALLSGGHQLPDALRTEAISIEGSRTAVTHFLGLFRRPEPGRNRLSGCGPRPR